MLLGGAKNQIKGTKLMEIYKRLKSQIIRFIVYTINLISSHRRKIVAVILSTILIALVSGVEIYLYRMSKRLSLGSELFTSLMYFGLVNLNIIVILIISFLIFRRIIRLVLDRKSGILGSKLKTKLVTAFVLFSVIPTAVMFFLSYGFISLSFDTWLSTKVKNTMHQTREAGSQVYMQDQRRIESLSRILLQEIDIKPTKIQSLKHKQDTIITLDDGLKFIVSGSNFDSFTREYQLDSVGFFDTAGRLVIGSSSETDSLKESVKKLLPQFLSDSSLLSKGVVETDKDRDVVRGYAPYYYTIRGKSVLVGIFVTQTYFKTQILKSMESILDEFSSLRPTARLVKLGYLILLIVMVVIIIFSSIWLGFYISKGLVDPIQSLVQVTREVALGNYSVSLEPRVQDETSTLINAFNRMNQELKKHEQKQLAFAEALQRTNKEIEQRREYMEVILQNISAGVISVDATGRVTSFNGVAKKILNIASQKVIDINIKDVLGERLFTNFWMLMVEKLLVQSVYSSQLDLKESGVDVKIFVAASRLVDALNQTQGIVVVFDDTTERVRYQRIAAWREVAQRIAHEIKNPITPIKLNAQRLSRRYKDKFDPEDQKVFNSCLDSILKQVDSLKDLVNEFSKFARLPKLTTQPVSINDIIREVINLYRLSYPKVVFDTSKLDEHLSECLIDKEQMSRVFINILTNALSAISSNPQDQIIWFRSYQIPDINMIRVEISDNGPGISDQDKPKVFEPYYSTKKEGTGLGLAIVNQIVGEHGGYIRLKDNLPRGLTVVIELPLQKED